MDNETYMRVECATREREERLLAAAEHWYLHCELPGGPGLRTQLAEWFRFHLRALALFSRVRNIRYLWRVRSSSSSSPTCARSSADRAGAD